MGGRRDRQRERERERARTRACRNERTCLKACARAAAAAAATAGPGRRRHGRGQEPVERAVERKLARRRVGRDERLDLARSAAAVRRVGVRDSARVQDQRASGREATGLSFDAAVSSQNQRGATRTRLKLCTEGQLLRCLREVAVQRSMPPPHRSQRELTNSHKEHCQETNTSPCWLLGKTLEKHG